MRDTSRDIFVRQQVDLRLNSKVTHLQVQNEMLLAALNGQSVCVIRLQNQKQTHVKLPIEAHDRIAFMHLDYGGVHALVSTVTGENFYINTRNPALKPLRRLKGHIISAVGWNAEYSQDSETGFVLLGTSKGALFEANISSSGSLNYSKQLSSNFTDKELPISGLHLRQCSDEPIIFLLLICVPNRLYCLRGAANMAAAGQQPAQQVVGTVWSGALVEQTQDAVLQALFNFRGRERPRFLSTNDQDQEEVLPSSLAFFHIHSPDQMRPKFLWLTADSLQLGTIQMGNPPGKEKESPDARELLAIDFNFRHRRSEGRLDFPLDIALTEHHILLLYSSRISAISVLDRSMAFEDFFTGVPNITGMCRDATSHMLWVFSDLLTFKYRPNEETRHVWSYYMEKKDFAMAKKMASQLRDERPFQQVIKREAEKFIADRNYVAAAESLDQSREPFESLVLCLLKDGPSSRNGLKRFLDLRLNKLQGNEQRMQRDMLVLWLLEIQLAELAELRRNVLSGCGDQQQREGTAVASTSSAAMVGQPAENEIRKLKEQLFCFLNRTVVFETISDNQRAVYRMVSSHVDFEVQLHLARKLRDHQTVIKILLLQKSYKEVLDILTRVENQELLYEFAGELFGEVPEELVNLLLKRERGTVNPLKLLPIFHKCLDANVKDRAKMVDAAFTFLKSIPPVSAFGPVLDFTIHLCATFRPMELLSFLRRCVDEAPDKVPIFDVGQALRICTERGLDECSVFLLCLDGLYEDAVKLALSTSIETAKQCARELEAAFQQGQRDSLLGLDILADIPTAMESKKERSAVTEEMRKRVWLEIAKATINSGASAKDCLFLLEESKGAIRIQDVLAHFPEFTSIQHFKEPLCHCLKEYSGEIENLQKQIGEANEMVNELRTDMEKKRSNFMVIRASDQCSGCRSGLLSRQFIGFACRHFFHRDCLESRVKTKNSGYNVLEKEAKVLRKEMELARAAKLGGRLTRSDTGRREEIALKKLNLIRAKMNELLCKDCPLCGLEIIDQVDKPFFPSPEHYGEQLRLWLP